MANSYAWVVYVQSVNGGTRAPLSQAQAFGAPCSSYRDGWAAFGNAIKNGPSSFQNVWLVRYGVSVSPTGLAFADPVTVAYSSTDSTDVQSA